MRPAQALWKSAWLATLVCARLGCGGGVAELAANLAEQTKDLPEAWASAEQRARTIAEAECSETPSQLHLALVADHTAMALSWANVCVEANRSATFRADAQGGALAQLQRRRLDGFAVDYWPSKDASQRRRVPAETRRYFLSYHHSVVMTGLEASTEYCYSVAGHPDVGSCFTTRSADVGRFAFASLGDMGLDNSNGTVAHLVSRAKDIAFVVHGGDIGYGDDYQGAGRLLGRGKFKYEMIYDGFMDRIESLASSVPYMVVPGNHDVSCNVITDCDCDEGQRNFTAYRSRFRMPSEESGAGPVESMWYSFQYGRVHFSCIDTESDFPLAPTQPRGTLIGGRGGGFGEQLAWLEQDLARARASHEVDWIVVVGHRQLYASKIFDYPTGISPWLRGLLEPMFLRHGVDLYIGAHIHNYERSFPVKHGRKCTAEEHCPVYVVNGAGGNTEGPNSRGFDKRFVAGGVYGEFGHAIVDVHNATHLNWQFWATPAGAGSVPRLADEFWLVH